MTSDAPFLVAALGFQAVSGAWPDPFRAQMLLLYMNDLIHDLVCLSCFCI